MMFSIAFCLYLLNPSSRGGNLLEIKLMSVYYVIEVYVAIVTFKDLSLRLDGANNLLQFVQFFWFHFSCLVEQDDVAELNLLDDEGSQIFFVNIILHKVIAVSELILHAQCVHHGDDAVQTHHTVLDIVRSQGGDGTDGLSYRSGFADATGFDDNVVKLLHVDNFLQLLYEIHLQRAADATVLQGNKRIVFLANDTTFFNQCGINVDFSYVIYDDGKLDAFLIGKDFVQQCCLATAQVTCQQQYRDFFCIHIFCCL